MSSSLTLVVLPGPQMADGLCVTECVEESMGASGKDQVAQQWMYNGDICLHTQIPFKEDPLLKKQTTEVYICLLLPISSLKN